MQKSQSKPKINIEKLNSARREIENLKLEIQTLIKPTLWYNVTSVKEQETKIQAVNNAGEPNVSSIKDIEVISEEHPGISEKIAQPAKPQELHNVNQKQKETEVEIKNAKPKKSSNTPKGTLTPKSLFKNVEPKSKTENLSQNKNTLAEKQKLCSVHTDPSIKDEASRKSMTSFIKKQRQLRKEKILQEELKKNEIKNARKKNLEILQQKQMELLKENIRKSKLSKKRASMTNLSKINQHSRVVERKRTKSLDRNVKLEDNCVKVVKEPKNMKKLEEKSTINVSNKNLTTEPQSSGRNNEKEKPHKTQAQNHGNKSTTGKKLQNGGNLTQANSKNIEKQSSSSVIGKNTESEITPKIHRNNQIENSTLESVQNKNKPTKILQSYTETDLCLKDKYLPAEIKTNSNEISFKSASETLLNKSIQVTNEIYFERSLVKPSTELRQLPIWLEKPEVLPYPYNFITTVKRKLDFATNNISTPKTGVTISEMPVLNSPKLPLFDKNPSQKIQLSTIPVLTSPEISENVPKSESDSEQVTTSYSSSRQDKQIEYTSNNEEKSFEMIQKVGEKSKESVKKYSEKSDSSDVKLSKSKENSASSIFVVLSKVSKRLDFSEKYDLKVPDVVLETKENSKRTSTSSSLEENLSKVSKRLDFSEKYNLKLPEMVLETKESSKSSGRKREVIDLSKIRSDSEHINPESDRDTIKNISDLSLEGSSKKSSEKTVSESTQSKSSKTLSHKLTDNTNNKSIRTELSNLVGNLDTVNTVSKISPEIISSKMKSNSGMLTENPGSSFEKVPLNSRKIENLTLKYTKTLTNMETYSDDFESVKIETSESESKRSEGWTDLKPYCKDSFAKISKSDLKHSNMLPGSHTKNESLETEFKFTGQKFPLNKYIKKETMNFIPKLEYRNLDNFNQAGVLNIEKENDKKVNPNGIHLKFQAEIHMLNSFKNSLQQIIDIEKSLYGEEEKENTIMEIEKAKNLINNPLMLNTINYKRGCDFVEDDRKSFNNTTQLNETKQTISDVEIYSNSSVKENNTGISRNEFSASLAMFDEMIKEEDKRLEKVKAVLKNKEKELLERTKGQLTLLEMRKRQSKDNGLLNDVTMIKKKQRGLIIKLEQERHEMQRLKQVHKEAAKQRKNALREQKNLIKAQLSSTDQIRSKIRRVSRSFKSHSGPVKVFRTEETFEEVSHTLSYSEEMITNESAVSRISKDLTSEIEEYEPKPLINMTQVKRFLQHREKCLEERQKNAEYILAWHKRLEAKEALVKELEKKAQELTKKHPLSLSGKKNTLNIDAFITKRSKENILEISGTEIEHDFSQNFTYIDSKLNKQNSSRSNVETPDNSLEHINLKNSFEEIYRPGSSSGISTSSRSATHSKAKDSILETSQNQLKTSEIEKTEKLSNEASLLVTESKLEATDSKIILTALKQGLNKLDIFTSKSVPETTPKIEQSSLDRDVSIVTQKLSKMSDMLSKSNAKKSEILEQLQPTDIVSNLSNISSQKQYKDIGEKNEISAVEKVETKSHTNKSFIPEIIDSKTTINESFKSEINDALITKLSDSSQDKQTSDILETPKTSMVESKIHFASDSSLGRNVSSSIITEAIESMDDDQIKTIQSEFESNISSSSPKTTNIEESFSNNSQPNKIESVTNNVTEDPLKTDMEPLKESSESDVDESIKLLSRNSNQNSNNSNLIINSESYKSSTINSDVFLPTNEILENEYSPEIVTTQEKSETTEYIIEKHSETQDKNGLDITSNEKTITSEAVESDAYITESKAIDSSIKSDISSKLFSDYNEPPSNESALKIYESSFEPENDNSVTIKSDTKESLKSDTNESIKSYIEESIKSDTKESIKSDTKESIKSDTKESIKSDRKESIKSDTKESVSLDINESTESYESKLETKLNLLDSTESKVLPEVTESHTDFKEITSPTQTTDSKQNEYISERETESKTSKVDSNESITATNIEINESSSQALISEQSKNIEALNSVSELGVNKSISIELSETKMQSNESSSKTISSEQPVSCFLEDETDRSNTAQSHKEISVLENSNSKDISEKLDKSEQSLSISSPKSTNKTNKPNPFDSAVTFDITQSDDNIVVEITNKDIPSLTSYRDTEAELLRKQMEIEYEIKQLERQELERQQLENIYFIREIPNKPPPPYKFPDENSSLPESTKIPAIPSMLPTEPEQITNLVSKSIDILYPSTSGVNSSAGLDLKNPEVGEKFVFDLCKEIIYDIYNNPNDQSDLPTWKLSRKKQFAEILTQNKPRNQRDLEKFVLKKALLLLNRRENSVSRCNRRKRDHVDEILIAESKSEEYEWVNFDFDEIVLKDKLTNDLLHNLIFDTITVINNAIYKKKTLHWF